MSLVKENLLRMLAFVKDLNIRKAIKVMSSSPGQFFFLTGLGGCDQSCQDDQQKDTQKTPGPHHPGVLLLLGPLDY